MIGTKIFANPQSRTASKFRPTRKHKYTCQHHLSHIGNSSSKQIQDVLEMYCSVRFASTLSQRECVGGSVTSAVTRYDRRLIRSNTTRDQEERWKRGELCAMCWHSPSTFMSPLQSLLQNSLSETPWFEQFNDLLRLRSWHRRSHSVAFLCTDSRRAAHRMPHAYIASHPSVSLHEFRSSRQQKVSRVTAEFTITCGLLSNGTEHNGAPVSGRNDWSKFAPWWSCSSRRLTSHRSENHPCQTPSTSLTFMNFSEAVDPWKCSHPPCSHHQRISPSRQSSVVSSTTPLQCFNHPHPHGGQGNSIFKQLQDAF